MTRLAWIIFLYITFLVLVAYVASIVKDGEISAIIVIVVAFVLLALVI